MAQPSQPKAMAELEGMLKRAQDQVLGAVRAEVFEGNLSKAVAMYTLAGGAYLDTLREVRARCSSCMARLRELKNYAAPGKSRTAAEAGNGVGVAPGKPDESDSDSDEDEDEKSLFSGTD